MPLSLKISILRLILVNLVPVVGVIFFDWELFEIAIAYILETICVYVVFDIDLFFIDKRTRFPVHFALIQFAFTMLTFSTLMYASAMIIFVIITPPMSRTSDLTDLFEYKLRHMEILFPFITLFILELITYYIRKAKDTNHIANSTWRVIRRILYSHLYIVGALIVLAALPQNKVVFIPFFIGLKLILEYSTEDERLFKTLWKKLVESPVGKYFQAKPAKKKRMPGYLFKKRTYTYRKSRE
ncbi:MAG: hypothetical protein HYZ14_09370 [Bacteroidetes bacterium]|nr:hypothetical protein [Bacteroidota bacterium]